MAGRTNLQVQGLSDFVRDLGMIPSQVAAAERIFGAVSARSVVERARQQALSGSRIQVRSAGDVIVGSAANTVMYGGKPWNMGAEFGAIQYPQFEPWRGNKDEAGYFLWPAIREFRDEDMLEQWVRIVYEQISKAFSD